MRKSFIVLSLLVLNSFLPLTLLRLQVVHSLFYLLVIITLQVAVLEVFVVVNHPLVCVLYLLFTFSFYILSVSSAILDFAEMLSDISTTLSRAKKNLRFEPPQWEYIYVHHIDGTSLRLFCKQIVYYVSKSVIPIKPQWLRNLDGGAFRVTQIKVFVVHQRHELHAG
ncbi:hypothetical protein O181_126080 [Austropuccinia psidii MF-1]|uniref:Uncharacterized protein n=1 Tax=Austropuccinia psidii MF-1 TaxID=1389203 RepID=A0A9Q3KQT5_9BASI|nr:hypothetical protein [Austropuccinia psidii MF-1]